MVSRSEPTTSVSFDTVQIQAPQTVEPVPTPSMSYALEKEPVVPLDLQLKAQAKDMKTLLDGLNDFKNSFESNKFSHSASLRSVTYIISTFSGNEKLVFSKLNELIGVVNSMINLQDLHGKFLKHDLQKDLKAEVSTSIKDELSQLPQPKEQPSI